MLDKSKSDSDTDKGRTNVPWAVVINTSTTEPEAHPEADVVEDEFQPGDPTSIETEPVAADIEPEAVVADGEPGEVVDGPEQEIAVTEPEAAAEPDVAVVEPEVAAEPEIAVGESETAVEPQPAADPEAVIEHEVAAEPEAAAEPDVSEPEPASDEQAAPLETDGKPAQETTEADMDSKAAPGEPATVVAHASCDDAVIRSLMDVLITPAGMVQPQERAFAADLLLHVVDFATPEAKRMLCERLSNMPDAPAALISRFIKDPDLDLSAILLLNASCVSDSELITVVENEDRDRSLLVAKRQHLSAAVGTALAKTGDIDLAMALVRNHYVQLSQEALQRLAVMALDHEDLIELLIMRPEMTAACALSLFWEMPAKQRSYALGRFLAEVQVLPQILVMSKPGADLVATALRASADAGNSTATDAAQPEKPSKRKAADLVDALESGCADTLAGVIQKHASIEAETAARIVADTGGEPLTVACKALGVSRFAFGAAVAAWRVAQGLEPDAEPLQLVFDTLSFKQARMALTYWEWQTQGIGPYKHAYFELSR